MTRTIILVFALLVVACGSPQADEPLNREEDIINLDRVGPAPLVTIPPCTGCHYFTIAEVHEMWIAYGPNPDVQRVDITRFHQTTMDTLCFMLSHSSQEDVTEAWGVYLTEKGANTARWDTEGWIQDLVDRDCPLPKELKNK